MSTLRVEDLYSHPLGPVSLAVKDECVCLSGPSGAGKTLLLRAIADLDPHRGQVFLDAVARETMSGPQWRRQVGYLASESQWWRDTVGEHFIGIDDNLLGQIGFDQQVLRWQVARLSSGERSRLALVRLLCRRPQVLLLDEPTANLDPKSVRAVEKVIAAYRAEHRVPILWVSHDPWQIERVADRHLAFSGGRLLSAQVQACMPSP